MQSRTNRLILIPHSHSPQVDRVVDHIVSFLQTSDLPGYLEFWEHLDQRFYSRLDASFTSSARKLDLLLKRYFLVVCVQNGKTDKITDFYRRLSSEIQSSSDWRDWLSEWTDDVIIAVFVISSM